MTKRRDIIKAINRHAKANGLNVAITEGGSHTKITVGDRTTVLPRHNEVNELTTKAIYKQIGMK